MGHLNKKKTIAFVTHSLAAGGAERVITTLANELSTSYNVVIITLIALPPFYALKSDIQVVHCKKEIPPSKNSFQALKTNYQLIRRIVHHLRTHKVDLCIGFLTTSNILSIIASKYLRIPVIVSERNNPYLEDGLVPRFWRIIRSRVYPFADFLVVQTETIKNYYRGKLKENKLKIIPNPINPDFKRNTVINRKNIILTVGRLADQKRQDLLIQAFANIRPVDWELHIIGEGENRPLLENLINELKLDQQVKLIGQTKNVQEHYETAKIFAFTSKYEGFPNALLEAMYFGMACVSTDCPSGPSSLIENGTNGFLIPVDDQMALEERLSALVSNEKEIENIGKAAEISTDRFAIGKIKLEWEALFNFK